jgi:hypothetical protein
MQQHTWLVRIHSPEPYNVVECIAEFEHSGFTVTAESYYIHKRAWHYVLKHHNKRAMFIHTLTHGDAGFAIKEGTL